MTERPMMSSADILAISRNHGVRKDDPLLLVADDYTLIEGLKKEIVYRR